MATALNRETADRTHPVEKRVAVQIGQAAHSFSLWMSKYTASKLSQEDWRAIGGRLRDHVGSMRRQMVLTGQLFAPDSWERQCANVEAAAKQFVQDQFRRNNVAAGNLEWRTDSLLAGEQYNV